MSCRGRENGRGDGRVNEELNAGIKKGENQKGKDAADLVPVHSRGIRARAAVVDARRWSTHVLDLVV